MVLVLVGTGLHWVGCQAEMLGNDVSDGFDGFNYVIEMEMMFECRQLWLELFGLASWLIRNMYIFFFFNEFFILVINFFGTFLSTTRRH